MYFYVEPEVSGGIGEHTVMDTSVHPPKVSKLHFQFDGWLGDDLLESFPCYIVSERLAKELELRSLTGFSIQDVEVSKSDQYENLYPGKVLPKFYWLQVSGTAGEEDFGIADDHRLVLSEMALSLLRKYKIEEADLEDY